MSDVRLSDIRQGDTIITKKNHPCGCNRWKVLSTGANFKLQCAGCAHTVILASESLKKSVKQINKQTDTGI